MARESKKKPATKTQLLKDFQEGVKLGVEYRKKYGRGDRWETYKNWYRGIFTGRGVVPVNITYAMARATISRARLADPRVVISAPMRPDLFFHAKLVEAIDNWLIRELGIKKILKRLILNTFLHGVAPWIVGYDSQYGFSPEDIDPETGETLTSSDAQGDRLEYDSRVSPGMPWVMPASPEDFVVPWGTPSFEAAQWYAIHFIRPTDEMKDDPKYKNRDEIKPNLSPNSDIHGRDSRKNVQQKMAEKGDFTEAWELHDRRTQKVYVFLPDGKKFIREEKDELQIDGFNAGVLDFNDDTDYFWSTPDAAILEPQQLEINDVTTQWSKHRRTAVAKIIAKKKAFDKGEIDKLTSENVRAVIEANVNDISKDIKFIDANIPDDFRIAREMIRQDAREAVGFSRNQLGEFQGKTHVSAAEQGEVAKGAEIRVDERRDLVADALTQMISKINQIIFNFWTQEQVIQIAGPDGAIHWVKYTGADLKGEYNIQIDPDAAVPQTKQARRAELMGLVELVAKAGGNIQPLLGQLVGEMPGLNVSEIFPDAQISPQGPRYPQGAGGQTPQSVQQFTQGQAQSQGGGSNGRFSVVGQGA